MGKSKTIIDIAEEAGVSIATVSRVLNGTRRVNEDKKKRIESVIKKYNFRPNEMARSLIYTKSNLIGMIVSDISNPFYSLLFESCERIAFQNKYNVILYNSNNSIEKDIKIIDSVNQKRVDALIIIDGSFINNRQNDVLMNKIRLAAATIPVISTCNIPDAEYLKITIDYEKQMQKVFSIAKKASVKRISFFGGDLNTSHVAELNRFFLENIKKYGFENDAECSVHSGEYDGISAYNKINSLVTKENHPDLIICVNDLTAAGIVKSMKEKKISINKEIKLISLENTYISDYLGYNVESVGIDFEKFGHLVMDNVMSMIKNGIYSGEIKIIPE